MGIQSSAIPQCLLFREHYLPLDQNDLQGPLQLKVLRLKLKVVMGT